LNQFFDDFDVVNGRFRALERQAFHVGGASTMDIIAVGLFATVSYFLVFLLGYSFGGHVWPANRRR
jgi:hypothetical protein